jgi:uncharacterized DUF497 family protein
MRTYTQELRFEWDETKNEANIRKHGIDFVDAPEIFDSPMLVRPDSRMDDGEARWTGLGLLRGRVVVVVYTEREDGNTVRIISLRKALGHERKSFADFTYRLEPHGHDER